MAPSVKLTGEELDRALNFLECIFRSKSHTIPVEIAQHSVPKRTVFRRKSHTVPF